MCPPAQASGIGYEGRVENLGECMRKEGGQHSSLLIDPVHVYATIFDMDVLHK